jgi:DNA transformation protein
MAVSQSYREFVLEQLGRVAPVMGKSMFGGLGIYAQGLFFALIAEDRLYFKVDEATRPEFEQRGMEPFLPFGEDSAMGYYEVPAVGRHSCRQDREFAGSQRRRRKDYWSVSPLLR